MALALEANMHRLFLALFLAAASAVGSEVVQVAWATANASPPVSLPANAQGYLPAFRLAMQALPESAIIALALSQPPVLGLTPAQAATLQPLVAERYRLIAASPDYSRVPTLLPYCFAEQRPVKGAANVYVPAGANAASPVLFFLHGYGGSFLWYQHYLSTNFPEAIVICPAFGIGDAVMPPAYASEALAAVEKRLRFSLRPPALIGLSAGGFNACRLFAAMPGRWSQLICLAAWPPDPTLDGFPIGPPARFLAGALEPWVTSGDFARSMRRVRGRAPATEAITVAGADHFFLLTHQKESVAQLHRWLAGEGIAAQPR
jgi:pimeloyl-ACP methyl ester carboxylesterase